MAKEAWFYNEGVQMDHTPSGAAVAAGQVVEFNNILAGVADNDIPDGKLGSITLRGAYWMAKGATAYATVGTMLYWDDATNQVTTTSTTNPKLGPTLKAAASGDAYVLVALGHFCA